MPVAKICTAGTLNAMKAEEGNDSVDTFIRQSIGREPVLKGDSPVQWIQFLHALEQPDLPGWPLLTTLKVQMQKCEKCSREFCSSINYRRHIRVHRRLLKVHKESHKYRELLAEFWDKLSLEEAKEVVLFNDVMLKEIPGSSVVRALASSLRKPGVWSLPQVYVKAGSLLLDILQAKPSRLPISSGELFNILDDASEGTFLCAGTAESVRKYVFDGETAKNSLELKNLVAATSFLFEQQLVKAWVADKDVEALRCQKLLVEEEEAAQKRQAALLERKKQRKLRQKEQKAKEQAYDCKTESNAVVDDVDGEDLAKSPESSSPSDDDSKLADPDAEMQFPSKDLEGEAEEQCDFSSTQGNSESFEHQMVSANGHHHLASNHWQVPKSQKGEWHGLHANHTVQTSRLEPAEKLGPFKDRAPLNKSKVWAKKCRTDSEVENLNPPLLSEHKIEESNFELIIGSISVILSSVKQQNHHTDGAQDNQQNHHTDGAQDNQPTQHSVPKKKNTSEKLVKHDTIQSGVSRVSKHWRPVSRGETKSSLQVDRGNEDSEAGPVLDTAHDRVMSGERCTQSEFMDADNLEVQKHQNILSDGHSLPGNAPFSPKSARDFLARRWKEAISSDHVKLVLSPKVEPHTCSDVQVEQSMAHHTSDLLEHSGRGDGRSHTGRSANIKFREKPEKNLKIKYVPKQKVVS